MSNVAPEHGPTPMGANRTGPGLGTGGSRPPKPDAGAYGSVSAEGPNSMSPFSDPNDSDNDMDTDKSSADLDY